MTINEIKALIETNEYDFLRTNKYLGSNVILLGLGGSHAYGTNNADSDVDIRGIATNSKKFILTRQDFEQVVNNVTDTTVYSLEKMIKLLSDCNPNTIEILGLNPEQYLYTNKAGQLLIDNKKIFLSKKAIYSFGGYANAQLRRLENKSVKQASQSKQEANVLKSIEHASVTFKDKYFPLTDDNLNLYLDESRKEDLEKEIYADINLSHYPLRDLKAMADEIGAIVKTYDKIGYRNEKAIRREGLGKHMMHLVRLYLMCFDILEKEIIVTYRVKEHDFLMSIRNGLYLDKNNQPIPEFYEIINEYEKRLHYAAENTSLPATEDKEAVKEILYQINSHVCLKES